jgi:pyruvate ferredoxin oxidoreductase gamma subunit
MFQVRIHGRGGQGVMTAAELLSVAAFIEGRYAQALPGAGEEIPGTPKAAHCRISDVPIRLREPIYRPDAVIVQDATLRDRSGVFRGLASGAYVLINSLREWDGLKLDRHGDVLCRDRTAIVPATEFALEHAGRPQSGPALLGGFAALTRKVSLEAVAAAVHRRFPSMVAAGHIDAARAAYAHVDSYLRQPVRA